MPVLLILSDLPPKIEQPNASTAEVADREYLSPQHLEISVGAESYPLTDLSSLPSSSFNKGLDSPKKTVYSVLPAWLTAEDGQAVDWHGGYMPTLEANPSISQANLEQLADQGREDNFREDEVNQSGSTGVSELSMQALEPVVAEPSIEETESVVEPLDSTEPDVELLDSSEPGVAPLDSDGIAELILQADRQSYNPTQQIVTASGDVLVQFGDTQLAAERLWLNLGNRFLRAEGDVFFNRNEQILEADQATYNLLQGSGEIIDARGELLLSTLSRDLTTLPFADGPLTDAPIDYRLQQEGSISSVTSPGGTTFGTDSRDVFGGEQGSVSRLRFESETIYFDADGWYAENLRLTNDPFSPPELELRGSNVRLTLLNEEQAELFIENPRLVFDQGLTIPLFKERYILQRGQLSPDELNPLPTGVGIDGLDRDGLYVEREFSLSTGSPWQFTVVPQFYIGRWLGESDYDLFDPANFGVVARVNGPLGPQTQAAATVSLSGLDLENFADRLRASFRTQQLIGDHRLSFEYSYRDRLFNGSLGFQDVQTSLGVLLQSPTITLGDTSIDLRYQVSGQYVTADTDQPDLLSPGVPIGLTSLFRFQGAFDLSRNFTLWRGEPLPATATEGLRYSPRPIVPFLSLVAGLRGIATYYTDDALRESLEARVRLSGQLGHLQRNYFDYTQFNIGYSATFVGGDESPFLFDREVDTNVLSGGIIQQIYGPLLAGFQTSFNLDTGQEIDTDFIVEYRRRAYGLLFQYSPNRETGFLGFRISDFDWTGRTRRFDEEDAAAGAGEEEIIVQ